MKVLVDTDVVLDVLLDRDPFAEGSKRLWASIERGAAQGFLAAHTLTTVHYLTRNTKDFRRSPVVAVDPLTAAARVATDPGRVSEPKPPYGKPRRRRRFATSPSA